MEAASLKPLILMMAVVGLGLAAVVEPRAEDSMQVPPQAPACQSAEHRQFDFWIGRWDVFLPNGTRAGTNSIEQKLGGCVLHEHWEGAGASRGESFNLYRRDRARWHQSWVDNSGTLLLIEGGLESGSMVLRGTTTNPEGRTVSNRITWTPHTADSVQQLWETSVDDGATWSTAFDGRYVRVGR